MFFIWALSLKIKTLAAFTPMYNLYGKSSMGGVEGKNAANDLNLWDSTFIC